MIGIVTLPSGVRVPALGQGTWRMGERASHRARETAALREGVALGMTLIDTAEMYGEGATETFLGEALADLRDEVFLVSKVYPRNASQARMARACEGSLKRLRTDRLDLYLLHWRGDVPLAETVAAFEALRDAGKIGAWGVSNFDTDDMTALAQAGGGACAANQILYNVSRRGPEFDLLPALAQSGVAVMAYSPVEQGRLPATGPLAEIAARHGATVCQVALAWTLRWPGCIVIPKSGDVSHVRDNCAAADLTLSPEDFSAIDAVYPPPKRTAPLDML